MKQLKNEKLYIDIYKVGSNKYFKIIHKDVETPVKAYTNRPTASPNKDIIALVDKYTENVDFTLDLDNIKLSDDMKNAIININKHLEPIHGKYIVKF